MPLQPPSSTRTYSFFPDPPLLRSVIHAWFYGAQGTLYAALFPTRIRYTGLSTVYQLSGVYSSGLTPLILTTLIALGGDAPWLACGYLVATRSEEHKSELQSIMRISYAVFCWEKKKLDTA